MRLISPKITPIATKNIIMVPCAENTCWNKSGEIGLFGLVANIVCCTQHRHIGKPAKQHNDGDNYTLHQSSSDQVMLAILATASPIF